MIYVQTRRMDDATPSERHTYSEAEADLFEVDPRGHLLISKAQEQMQPPALVAIYHPSLWSKVSVKK